MQRQWKKWVEKREMMIEKMNGMWTKTLEGLLKDAAKNAKNAKKLKKKKDLTPGYLQISQELKRKLLLELLNKALADYSVQLQAYLTVQMGLMKGGKSAFLLEYERNGPLTAAPVLQCVPSREEMRSSINRAARLSLQA